MHYFKILFQFFPGLKKLTLLEFNALAKGNIATFHNVTRAYSDPHNTNVNLSMVNNFAVIDVVLKLWTENNFPSVQYLINSSLPYFETIVLI